MRRLHAHQRGKRLPALPYPRSSLPRFGVRALLASFVVLSVVLAAIMVWVNGARVQQRTVAEIRALGGTVVYSYQHRAAKFREEFPQAEPRRFGPPEILRNRLGVDFLASIQTVDLSGAKFTLPQLHRIRQRLPHAKILLPAQAP